MPIRLVVGLGNPGAKYEGTRHNVGFLLIDRLARFAGQTIWKEWQGQGVFLPLSIGEGSCYAAKPLTFMNDSGRMVRSFSDFYKIAPAEILIIYDDFALPLGRLRIRQKGGAGGHNGVKSIIDAFSTEEIPRLRFGIGPSGDARDSRDYVLSRFAAGEKAELEKGVERAGQAIETALAQGLETAMNKFNPAAAPEHGASSEEAA